MHQLVLAIGASEAFTRNRLADARTLAGTLAATGAALAAGWLSEYKARLIVKHTEHLDDDVARTVEAYVLPKAATMKAPNLVACIGRQVLNADPAAAERKHRQGRGNRRVVVERSEREPGLLLLEAALPPALMIALDARLDAKAKEFGQADRAARKKPTRQPGWPAASLIPVASVPGRCCGPRTNAAPTRWPGTSSAPTRPTRPGPKNRTCTCR